MSSGLGGEGVRSRSPCAHAAQERRPLGQLVECQGEVAPLGHARERVARAADALQERRDRARGADLQHEVHVADVDAQLERGRRDESAERSRLEPLLGVEPALARQAPVVAGDRVLAQDLRELRGDPLGHLPRVHENERRAVLADQVRHPGVDLLPLLVRADGGERRGRDLDRQVERAEAARVHERALAPRAGQEAADLVERLLRRREPDPLDLAAAERLEPLEREGEVAAALVAHERVDLVHDHRAHVGQLGAAARAREQEVERLGRRDQDVRRAAAPSRPAATTTCRPSAPAPGSRAGTAPGRGSRPAARTGSSGRRSKGPAAARRRAPESCRGAPAPGAAASRSPRGTRRASCPSPWARRSACAVPRG